jgi:DNA repair exonuclease SbcCD ATPase subunit
MTEPVPNIVNKIPALERDVFNLRTDFRDYQEATRRDQKEFQIQVEDGFDKLTNKIDKITGAGTDWKLFFSVIALLGAFLFAQAQMFIMPLQQKLERVEGDQTADNDDTQEALRRLEAKLSEKTKDRIYKSDYREDRKDTQRQLDRLFKEVFVPRYTCGG